MDYVFFREATMRICGDLRIEKALQSCLEYIKEFIPVDRLHLQRFDKNYGTMHTVALATIDSSSIMDVLIPVSDRAKQVLRLQFKDSDENVRIFNQPEENPLCSELIDFFSISCSALMVMRLHLRGEILGSIAFVSFNHKYNSKHSQLVSSLMEPFAISLSNALKHNKLEQLNSSLIDNNQFLNAELQKVSGNNIIGANFGLRDVMEKVRLVSALESPVLLLGETGVGKDLIASAIHNSSPRKSGPFIKVNCGAIPETLIDSELFGYEKGAFTGAVSSRKGKFERAQGGTIFLDEIGEIPLALQARLLRVLQNKEIERIGGNKPIKLDFRFIAATNRNLESMVASNQFREDLWFRLNVFPLHLPPLRSRKMDIPALVKFFIEKKVRELKLKGIPELGKNNLKSLQDYSWPGNVRELENVIERALIMNKVGPLNITPLLSVNDITVNDQTITKEILPLDEMIKQHIIEALNKAKGKINGRGGAAEILGVHPNTLRNRMRNLGINFGRAFKEKK